MLFASGGFKVKLYDIEQEQITNALENIRKEMKLLEQSGSLKGSLSVEEQLSLISGCSNIEEAVEGALHIQECVPENLQLKKKIFAQLDRIIDDTVVLASSTSCLMPSKLFAGLAHMRQCLVAHPVNPPYHIPLVELVPHLETAPATVDRTHALMRKIGQCPVRVLKEVDGFVLNRLQYPIISEAWRLVERTHLCAAHFLFRKEWCLPATSTWSCRKGWACGMRSSDPWKPCTSTRKGC
ncbi:PREDICTED: lambda-crystallin homolog isoform X2 [Galeopterus variegatus]|uniref:Lambda-crystallin homolog isoform X2 n=1 Tax=Galeopterus variegatus TaxID=482537 RepID=A0ABM0REB9_GALVR|nr:PREDICTED: lambda-crystallin homolog isoform X2 [Galeopterus variegatus]